MVSTGSVQNVPEHFKNEIVPTWGEYVLLKGRALDGQPQFFEVTTHNSPSGQAATNLTRSEIIQDIRMKIDPETLIYLGEIQSAKGGPIHVWTLKLANDAVKKKPRLAVKIGSSCDPSTKFCTEIVEAEFILRKDIPIESDCGPIYLLRVHTDLDEEYDRMPKPYES